MPKNEIDIKMYNKIVNNFFKKGIYESSIIIKKTKCTRQVYVTIFSHYLKEFQKQELEIMDKVSKDELEVEDFSPAPEDEKDMPSLGFESLIDFESDKNYEP